MRADEIEKMNRLDDWYWWFVGNRELVSGLVGGACGKIAGAGRLRILDVGCGTGAMLSRLGTYGRAFGADRSVEALGFCRQRGAELLCQCNATQLPFPDGTFQIVVASHILEHVAEDDSVLEELDRVLAPGGRMIATIPAHRFLWSAHDVALSHKRRYSRREVADKIRKAGFVVERVTYTNFFIFPIVVALRLFKKVFRPAAADPKTDLVPMPALLNRALVGLYRCEAWILARINVGFGVNLACIARKGSEA